MKGRLTLAVAMISLAASPAFGDSVTLREAIGRALSNNHLLKAASLQEGAAKEGVAVSRSRYLPRVYLQSGAELSTTPSTVFMMKLDEGRINPDTDFSSHSLNNPDPRGDFRSSVTLEQPLLDFGISTGVELAGKEAEAAAASLKASREQLAYRVYLAYLEVRRARANREIADQAVADAKEHDRLAGVREKDGVGLKSDRLRTSTELSEAEQRLISAQNDLLLARLKLNLVVGGREGEALDISETPLLAESSQPPEELVALAQQSRPELEVDRKQVEKQEVAVRQAKAAYLPTVYASASYQINDRDVPFGVDNDSWTVGVNLRWELFDGTRRGHEKSRAELNRQAAAEMLENDRREVAIQVTESLLRRQEAQLKVTSARNAVKAAEEGVRLIALRYQNGLSSMVELLDAEAALNRARVNLVEVENSRLISQADVYHKSGVLLKEVMR